MDIKLRVFGLEVKIFLSDYPISVSILIQALPFFIKFEGMRYLDCSIVLN